MALSSSSQSPLPTIFVVFGVTGDLARRKLLPAFWHLFQHGMLPPLLQIIGFARQNLSRDVFRSLVAEIVGPLETKEQQEQLKLFLQLFYYQSGLFEDASGYAALAKTLGKQDEVWNTCANKLFYLAAAPTHYKTIFQNLADSGLTIPCSSDEGWTRVIVEKPFGRDLQTAQELDGMLGRLFREEQIYRIDHYLGKDTVQNILAFRFSNSFLEPAWDARSIASIHIKVAEELEIAGRAAFYDEIGALRDFGQNHILQMLALFTMQHPGAFDAASIRTERTKILESLEAMDEQDVARHTVRGQYEGYKSIEGVSENSQTETYFRLQTSIASSHWRGVPITLECGKALDTSSVEVIVTFRHQTPCLCPPGKHYTNTLRYRIQPEEGISMSFWAKKPGQEMVIEQKDFTFDYRQAFEGKEFVNAYAKLLLDAIAGDQTLFVSTDEIMASWRFIDPIIEAWNKGAAPLQPYSIGSKGLAWPPKTDSHALPEKEIGYIGLGKMGSNMVERLHDYGWQVTAFDPDSKARQVVEASGVSVVETAASVVSALQQPRLVWLMVPHQVVDTVLQEILPSLQPGDVVIDAGNSFYKDSVRRAKELLDRGIDFLDIGVSGGPSGARKGACLMVGGEQAIYRRYVGLFSDVATAGGYDYVGKSGAGHFVKMVHNGIEYGMMQAIAEGFAVMKNWSGQLNLERIANLYNHDSVIESRLVGWLKDAYAKHGEQLDDISGMVSHSGEGAWTVEAAKELGIPVPIIEGALQFRVQSKDDPSYTGQVLSALRNQFGGHEVSNNPTSHHSPSEGELRGAR